MSETPTTGPIKTGPGPSSVAGDEPEAPFVATPLSDEDRARYLSFIEPTTEASRWVRVITVSSAGELGLADINIPGHQPGDRDEDIVPPVMTALQMRLEHTLRGVISRAMVVKPKTDEPKTVFVAEEYDREKGIKIRLAAPDSPRNETLENLPKGLWFDPDREIFKTIRPKLGQLVTYRLSAVDAALIGQRRLERSLIGNQPVAGQEFPAHVVAVSSTGATVNLQVILDGEDTYWATSRALGVKPGEWTAS